MPEGTHTLIRNPETGGVWECPNTVLGHYIEGRGWTLVEGEPAEDDLAPAEPKPFDPNEHSAKDVQAYLDSVSENDAEVQRVLAVERAGQARVSIVGKADTDQKE